MADMTLTQAATLVRGCGDEPLVGDEDEVRRQALAICEAAARLEGWQGEWQPTAVDEEYVEAQLLLAEHARTIHAAIRRSISHTEIVTLPYTDVARDYLVTQCDDSADGGPVWEFWGTDDTGAEWRVHLEQREAE